MERGKLCVLYDICREILKDRPTEAVQCSFSVLRDIEALKDTDAWTAIQAHVHAYTHTHTHLCMYVCMYLCMWA